jgi:Heliorhodopsin
VSEITAPVGRDLAPAIDSSVDQRLNRLRWWNIVVGLVLAVQAVMIAVLTNNFSLPVTATFMEGPPGTAPKLHHLFDIATGWGIFAFLAISAGALLIIASPLAFDWYKRNLLRDRNYGRWIEYFFSSSIMIVLISQLTGISDIAALLAIFGINACMILFGLLMEKYETPGKANWLAFWFGSFAGIIPWVAVVIYTWAPGISANPPAFVYGIIISLFVFFNCFAVNMVLQYKQVGPWRDYLFGEKVYILLSLTAKALLAWQVFFPVLMGTGK